MRTALLTALTYALLLAPAYGEEPTPRESLSLLEAAAACPLPLAEAMAPAYGYEHKPLRAELVLDTKGRLLVRAWVRVTKQETVSYERWTGPVGAAGWVPRKQALESEGDVSQAKRLWALLEQQPNRLRQALRAVVRTEERAGPAERVLSIAPDTDSDSGTLLLTIDVGGKARALRFEPASSTSALGAEVPEPKRVPHERRTLPPLEVPDGTWFNVDGAPTLETWRGKPVLLVVTDPG